jgi:multiple sugar transport system ATP-binding protein
MTMADRIVVLNKGNIEQVGSPLELYNRPDSLFVAGFIGSPKMNFITGEVAAAHGVHTIGVRPEHLSLTKTSGEWEGTIALAEHLGADTFLHVDTDKCGRLTVRAAGEYGQGPGDKVWLTPEKGRIHRFDGAGTTIRNAA